MYSNFSETGAVSFCLRRIGRPDPAASSDHLIHAGVPTMRRILFSSLLILSTLLPAAEIGFAEDFALAANRDDALKQLIPGTDDYYYYHAVHYQNSAQFDKVEDILKQWVLHHGENVRVSEIKNRQALMQFEKDPKKTFDFLKWRLGLNFDHQRHVPGQKPNYATQLDPKLIALDTLTTNALNRHGELSGFDDSALDLLWANPTF